MWLARDKNGELYLHLNKPEKIELYYNKPDSVVFASDDDYGDENYTETKNRVIGFIDDDFMCGVSQVHMSRELFPEVTFENSPKELILK